MMAHRCVLNKTFLLVDFVFPIQIMWRCLRGLNLCRVYWKDGSGVIKTSVGRHSRPRCRPTYRPIVDRHIGRYSVGISADCWSTYRPRVSTDTRSTEVFITHVPKKLRASMEMSSYVLVKQKPTSEKGLLHAFYCSLFFFWVSGLRFWKTFHSKEERDENMMFRRRHVTIIKCKLWFVG